MDLKLESMAGFTLGGGGGSDHHHNQTNLQVSSTQQQSQQGIQSETLFQLYSGNNNNRSQDIAYTTPPNTRGFELWQQHQQQIQRQQQQQELYPSSVGSLLAFSNETVLQIGGAAGRSIELSMRGHSSGSMSCQDCGNQAKKDCIHLRCRTCCKSRGLQCSTHVKSTWVPAAKRRERQQQLAAAASLHRQRAMNNETQQQPVAASLRIGGEASKSPREIMTITAANTASSGAVVMETSVRFPSEVSSQAIFRCVRVSPIDDEDEEFAYQTSVSIGGHVFKGILYDHGPDSQYPSTPSTGHHVSEFLSSANAATAAIAAPNNEVSIATALAVPAVPISTTVVAAGTSAVADPNSLYPAPLSAFMVGTQFFPHSPRPN